ncbi:MAG: biotin--[acetyl-CoA-carboxylase] ligase [Chlamydiia bacterium]
MLKGKYINYIHFASLDSTNTWAKNNAHMLDPQYITCITAKEQTAGRGRFFRKWLSPKGYNIYATLYFQIPKTAIFLSNLGQLMCLSCCSVLAKQGFFPEIKWPNDILLSTKKVGGILCETISFDESLGIILGFGINVNMPSELLTVIDQPATSLLQQSGKEWEINELLEPIVLQFIHDLDLLEKHGFPYFQKTYENLLAYKGQSMSWTDGMRKITGVCQSISEDGKLNLMLSSGETLSLSTGEISLS